MSATAANELWSIFDARRVKAPELKGLDALANSVVGWFKNRRRMLSKLRRQAERIEVLEKEIHDFGAARFAEEVERCRELARLDRLEGAAEDRGMALAREAAWRTTQMRPFPVQLMGALAMIRGNVAEMATGEGKTLTASLAASIWAWHGRPVHILTVNDYLVERDAHEMGPVYKMLGLKVGSIVHETTPEERIDHYRRDVVYVTNKELVADFLRDQIQLGTLRNAAQTNVRMLMSGQTAGRLMIPGLFRAIIDEADSLLIDEAVTPLIISNSPDDDPNETYYRAAAELAGHLEINRDFTIDWTTRNIDLTARGHDRLDDLCEQGEQAGFWQGRRRREELVTLALSSRYCYVRDEQYLLMDDEEEVQKQGHCDPARRKVAIIDEYTGRIMADRSWRHGLHQAIEVKESVKVTADKENLARLSFQRFFRQYPHLSGMTGTAWEGAGEMWQIYHRPIIRIPTNKPCIRRHLPVRMFDTMEQKWQAVVKRTIDLNEKGVPVLIGTRSVLASEEVSRRLTEAGKPHQVLNASHTAQEAFIVAQAGQRGQITVATNMAGRGTDIKLAKGVAEIGGLHVIATEPHGSGRVDRQLFGRAARQGDPGAAQMFCSKEDDLFIRHGKHARHAWRGIGPKRLIKMAQASAERMARFHRKQVLKQDDWMDEALPF
jgi:preprotein translocase subunit SecA